ncbi:MAG: hypothetical protein FJ096_01620 [Deltaproteobacteria bacterium]|nr:hypothetical protein [Deltaproteobacteria bacterium]
MLWEGAAACGFDRSGSLPAEVTTASGVGGMTSGVGSSLDAATAGVGGTGGDGGSTGTLEPPLGCGDGAVDPELAEACDDGNNASGDGCSAGCKVEGAAGWSCETNDDGASERTHTHVLTNQPPMPLALIDDGYKGPPASMTCLPFDVKGSGDRKVTSVALEIRLQHQCVGNVVVKVVAPSSDELAVMSRPGFDEPADDGGVDDAGEDPNASAMFPLRFDDGAGIGAESVGEGLSQMEEVCAVKKQNPDPCEFHPEPGNGGPGGGFSDFAGQSPDGKWRVCVGDANPTKAGHLHGATLTIRSR